VHVFTFYFAVTQFFALRTSSPLYNTLKATRLDGSFRINVT